MVTAVINSNRYNLFNIRIQLIFAFSSPLSVQARDRQLLSEIIPRCCKSSAFSIEQITLLSEGVEIQLTMSPEMEIPMLVNTLKTHSAKQLGEQMGVKKNGLWLRGYVAHSFGDMPEAQKNLSALMAKNRREK
ncbi:transposase [Ewingella americana]|uniref:transposase n=1 Tax=Ewingella americana TaxID=41202 RepID=UPI0032203BBD